MKRGMISVKRKKTRRVQGIKVLAAALLISATAGTGESKAAVANEVGVNVILGEGAHSIERNGVIAIGYGATADYKSVDANQEQNLSFGAGNDGLPGPIAIGTNTYARTGTVQIGAHSFSGKMGGITVNSATNGKWALMDMTMLGSNTYAASAMGVAAGAYSIITGNYDASLSGISGSLNRLLYGPQNFGAVVVGSLNSIRSSGYGSTAGVANSIVGIANIAEDTNGTLIFGAGNKVAHATGTIGMPAAMDQNNVDTAVDGLRWIVKDGEGGGAALVIGGGNEAEYVRASQLIGTNNTLKGTASAPSVHNLINGTGNEAANVSNSMIIGRNRQLIDVSDTIVIGSLNTKAATTASRAVVLGHEANVLAADGGVALGYGSIADRAGFAESTIPPFSGEMYGIDLNGITDGAVSVGTADTLRQLINLADATEPTDAVNLRQLRGGLSFEVISGGQSQGTLNMSNAASAPIFEAGAGLLAEISGDQTIVFRIDTDSDLYKSLKGEQGEKGDKGEKGDTGAKGDKGDTGAVGPQGEKGDTGAAGPQGPQGDKGDTGVSGPQGEKGNTGATGPQGPQGDKGDTGAVGPQGPQGDKGDTGPQGPKGDKGDTGYGGTWKLQADGDAADIVTDGATVQFKSGSNIAVSRSGTNVTIGAVDAPVFAGKVTANGFDASRAKITNVAPGTISSSSTDAVNGSQLWGASSSIAAIIGGGSTVNADGSISAPRYVVGGTAYTTVGDAVSALDSRFDSIRGSFDDLRDDIKITSALSAALAGLHPIQYDPKEPTQFMASVGNYRDKWAFALGLAHYTREDFMIHAGAAMSGNSRAMANAGLTWKFGRQEDREAVAERYRKGPITSVAVLQQENEQLLARVAQLQQTSTVVQARLDALERRVLSSGK